MHRAFAGVDQPAWVPLRTWPPGFPLLMAAFHSIGLSAYTAGIIVDLIFGGIFVLILSWLCLQLFPPVISRFLLLLPESSCLPSLPLPEWRERSPLHDYDRRFSHLPDQLVEHKRGSLAWVFAAGLLAGASYLFRYVGLTLLASSTLIVLSMSHRPGRDWRSILTGRLALASVLHLCLFTIHCLWQSVLPYSWPANKEPFWEILRHMGNTLGFELTTSMQFTGFLVNKYNALFFLMLSIPGHVVHPAQTVSHAVEKPSDKEHSHCNSPLLCVFLHGCHCVCSVEVSFWRGDLSQVHGASKLDPLDRAGFPFNGSISGLRVTVSGSPNHSRTYFHGNRVLTGSGDLCYCSPASTKPCNSLNDWLGEGAGTLLTKIPDDQIVLSDRPVVLRSLGSVNARVI